jgi:hypothetical protein
MDKKKLIENIKNQIKNLMSSEVKFTEVKSGDLIISSPDEELLVGSEVFTIDQDGNNIPLGDGDYTLDSGETLTVVNGVVEAIINAEAPEAVEAAEDDKEEEIVDEEKEDEEKEDEDEMGNKDKMKKMEERLTKCEKMLEEMKNYTNKMSQELSTISSLPSTKSISVEPAEYKSVEDKKSGAGSVDIMSIRERARAKRK